MSEFDAIVVGSGPNGIAAAITLAEQGASVHLIEGNDEIGGGTRTSELTLPGYLHDVCSAIHPLGELSPFFRTLPLEEHGLKWISSPIPLVHPLDNGKAVWVERSVSATASNLGSDRKGYERIMQPFVDNIDELIYELLKPIGFPKSPFLMSKYFAQGLLPASVYAKIMFKSGKARALFAGMAAHSVMPLSRIGTAAFGIMFLATAHAVGWPMAQGGSHSISKAMESYFKQLGGKVTTGWTVDTIEELPKASAYLFDVGPEQILKIAGKRFSQSYIRRLKKFTYGPGVYKIDYALSEPIPWTNSQCRNAATLHLGGSLEEIVESESIPWEMAGSGSSFVLLAQQSLFDTTRSPNGKHTAWAYCHVTNGSSAEMTNIIEDQIERFAPGFRDIVEMKSIMTTRDYQAYNPNYIGGDIIGGANTISQIIGRPTFSRVPYKTADPNIYLCSASTPPGGGVHGMSGYHAAKSALKYSIV